jgi:DNA-binding XRE family transcriptional regulator
MENIHSCFITLYFVNSYLKRDLQMKMTKRDIAGYLGIDYKTLFNWEKNRPNLYKTIMLGLMVEEIIEKSEKNLEELKEIKKEFETKKR